jgi:hypothetical protein
MKHSVAAMVSLEMAVRMEVEVRPVGRTGLNWPNDVQRGRMHRLPVRRSKKMSIDWASVNWAYVALLSGFAFIAALVANFITFRHRLAAAILASLLFAAMFVFATYAPHGIALPTLK